MSKRVQITYIGGSAITCGWDGGGTVAPGETIGVDKARADELTTRPNWKRATVREEPPEVSSTKK